MTRRKADRIAIVSRAVRAGGDFRLGQILSSALGLDDVALYYRTDVEVLESLSDYIEVMEDVNRARRLGRQRKGA